MRTLFGKLWSQEQGQDLTEYALLVALLAVVVAGLLPPTLVSAMSSIYSKVASTLAIS